MILSDEEAFELKAWVVKKLEDISDADSDVLGDYVLALIRADTPEPELRLSAIANLEDFLQDKAEKFVDETFQALHSKSYKPGYVHPPATVPIASLAPTAVSPITPLTPRYPQDLSAGRQPHPIANEQSRKRSYNDHHNGPVYNDPHYAKGDRQIKQMRRGGLRGGRYGDMNGRSSQGPSESPLNVPPPGQFPFPGMPPPPSDPNDPLMAMMLQAMGMPLPPANSGIAGLANKSPIAFSPPGQGSPTLNGARSNEIKARCSDYDTRGFCVRGNTCPFEHGNDHMVAPGQEAAEYDPKNSAITDVPSMSPTSNGFVGHDASLWSRDQGHLPNRGQRGGRGQGYHASPRGPKRAEFSHAGPNSDRSNTTIVVENIPEEKFDEGSVRSFFSAFGTITEVDMRPYKHLAIVKYADYWAAKSAYDSPKVIFDNRFVKVYWYKPGSVVPTTSTEHHKNNHHDSSISSPTSSAVPTTTKEPEFNREEFEKNAQAAQKKLEEKKALMKDAEEKRQLLEKQKFELAQKQAEEKRRLLEKIQAKKRKSSGAADDDSGGGGGAAMNGVDKQTNGTTTAADADDDKASAQTKALRAQVAALEAEAKSLGLDTALSDDSWAAGRGRGRGRGRGGGRGRGSYRGWEGFAGRGAAGHHDISFKGSPRGRGGFGVGGGAYNLDNRTKKVGVSGVEFNGDRDEALRQYLFAIGEFEAIESSAEKPDTQIITFKDRYTAERFMYGTKNIPSVGTVELAWVNTPLPPVMRQNVEKGGDADGDAMMVGNVRNDGSVGGGGEQQQHGMVTTAEANVEVDYDVAEEDDRWMAS